MVIRMDNKNAIVITPPHTIILKHFANLMVLYITINWINEIISRRAPHTKIPVGKFWSRRWLIQEAKIIGNVLNSMYRCKRCKFMEQFCKSVESFLSQRFHFNWLKFKFFQVFRTHFEIVYALHLNDIKLKVGQTIHSITANDWILIAYTIPRLQIVCSLMTYSEKKNQWMTTYYFIQHSIHYIFICRFEYRLTAFKGRLFVVGSDEKRISKRQFIVSVIIFCFI